MQNYCTQSFLVYLIAYSTLKKKAAQHLSRPLLHVCCFLKSPSPSSFPSPSPLLFSEEQVSTSAQHALHSSVLLPSVAGLVRSSGMFGPTLGFLLGSFCASLWVDIGIADIGKSQCIKCMQEPNMLGSTLPVYCSKKGGSPEGFPTQNLMLFLFQYLQCYSVTVIDFALSPHPHCRNILGLFTCWHMPFLHPCCVTENK